MKTCLTVLVLILLFSAARLSWAKKKPKPTISLATYNAALNPQVLHYDIRREKIVEKIAKLKADVVCLQGVYFSRDMLAIIEAVDLQGRFPYRFSLAHQAVSELRKDFTSGVPCNNYQFKHVYLPCVEGSSPIDSEKQPLDCSILRLTEECAACLTLADQDSKFQTCSETYDENGISINEGYRVNTGGIAFLSDLELEIIEINEYDFGRMFMPKLYILARVKDFGEVLCTHQTAYLGEDYFEELPYGSWAAQNLMEAKKAVERLEMFPKTVIMGALNTSPNRSDIGISPQMPESFAYYLTQGYGASYITDGPGNCTSCSYNPSAETNKNCIVDHILTRNLLPSDSERIFDEYDEDFRGYLSPNFGVKTTFNKKNL